MRFLKKIAKFSIVFFILCTALLYYVSESNSINPFYIDALPLAESEFENSDTTLNKEVKILQLKADSIINNSIAMNDFISISSGVYHTDKGV